MLKYVNAVEGVAFLLIRETWSIVNNLLITKKRINILNLTRIPVLT